VNTESLVGYLDQDELIALASPIVAWNIGAVHTMEEVAQFMYRGGRHPPQASLSHQPSPDIRPEKTYWHAVKIEMHTFLCTDDKKYKELWKRIAELDKKSTSAIVALIAAYLGSIIGVAGTLLAGFVTLCLYAISKIGKEAYCRYVRQGET